VKSYDVIVIGIGGMGSSALYHLARRGLRVLGIEQFRIGHDRGSSHGETRIIRRAYFEHPDYVPLVDSAYRHWFELEKASGVKLFYRTGLMLAGPPEGAIIAGVRRAAHEHAFAMESMSAGQARDRFAGLTPSEGMDVLFEPDAGLLVVERCVETYAAQAMRHGAELITGACVKGWSREGSGWRVRCGDETYLSDAIVLCAGAWTGPLLGSLGLPLEIRRKVVVWFACDDQRCQMDERFPIFGFETEGSFFFGFPAMGEPSVKTCDHFGGERPERPEALDRELHERDVAHVWRYVQRFLPGVSQRVVRHSVCMYTMTPDEHFIIDRHPEHENVVFACGFSGHGFKFASVTGSVLADLVTLRSTSEPVGFLRLDRSTLRKAQA
jgi:sarcosine oxidase